MLKQVQAPPKVRKFIWEGTFINSQNINDFTIETKTFALYVTGFYH